MKFLKINQFYISLIFSLFNFFYINQLSSISHWKIDFTKAKLKKQQYNVQNQEMLVIIEALKKWRTYLLETKHQTIIKSDHKNLQYFMTTKKLNKW